MTKKWTLDYHTLSNNVFVCVHVRACMCVPLSSQPALEMLGDTGLIETRSIMESTSDLEHYTQ